MNDFKPVSKVSSVSLQQVMDNYFQLKLDIKALIEHEVYRLKIEKDEYDSL